MSLNRRYWIVILLATVVVVNVIIYVLLDFGALIAALMIEAPAIELFGVIVAAVPEIPYLRGYTTAVKTVNRINTAVDRLNDRGTTIDDTVPGFHDVASELVDQTGIEYPTTIQSTRIATAYWIDNGEVVYFNMNTLAREARRLEQRSREWFQSAGLTVIAVGFAVQLIASIFATLL